MSDGVDRRAVLRGIGGTVVVGSVGSSLLGTLGCRAGSRLEDALPDCVSDREAAGTVGAAFLLRAGPKQPTAAELVEEIVGEERASWEALAQRGGDGLIEAVRERHLTDFAAGRTTRVRGWILSDTEARVAALIALRDT